MSSLGSPVRKRVEGVTSLLQAFEECDKVIWTGVGFPTPGMGDANAAGVRRYRLVPLQSARFLE